MRIPVFRHGTISVLTRRIGWAWLFLAAISGRLLALTPSSPEVKEAIDRGVQFLASDGANDERFGAKALVGLVLLTHGEPHDHPKIVDAAAKIHAGLTERDPAKFNTSSWDVYSTGLAIIFLCDHDPAANREDIECLLKYLRWRQKPHGGWGYLERETGDTSMTQYGVLSSWTASHAGFNVPQESIEAVATWLMKTQDPSGGFGYQGTIAKGNALEKQSEIRPSMTAAGSGSLFICASFLDLIEQTEKRKDLPTALKEIKSKEAIKKEKERIKTRIDLRQIRETQSRAKDWMEANYKMPPAEWPHYYLYALERCMSFRELFEHKAEKEPQWYDDGAEWLMKTQGKEGSWNGQCGAVPDTAFGVLFLMRSTKKKIEKALSFGEGTMIGGRGIPKDTSEIEVRGGHIVARPLLGPAEKLLAALEKPDGRDFDRSVELLQALPSDKVEDLTAKYGDKIRMLVNSNAMGARLAAVQALGKTRNLDNVETLIYALTDPSPQVVQAADQALLRIRRAPGTSAISDSFSEEDRRLLIEKWKAWYQTIRPGAEEQ